MPAFLHYPLLWGMLLVGLPVLIHLINMLRHRRVQWAAMEFLLTSQKRNRTWVLLKQLLLLIARMAVIALIVLVVAQPLLRSRGFAGWFGGTKHHVVLLDDSFSMSDRWGDTSAFEQAKDVVRRIGEAAQREGSGKFTLLRFSQAGRIGRNTQPDMLEQSIDNEFNGRLGEALEPLKPSQNAATAAGAMDAVDQLLEKGDSEHRVVYLVTDFRARQWDDPAAERKRLSQWAQKDTELYLINCVDATRPNLAITELAPAPGTRAAGVFFFTEVTVQNFGDTPVRDVTVLLEADGQARPSLVVPSIPPRSAVKERYQERFDTAGEHRLTARLEADAIAADNTRFAVIDVPLTLPVLLVDGAPEAQDAWYLSAAFNPGGSTPSGIAPRTETPRFLSSPSVPLNQFSAIYLLNVDRLDQSAIGALEQYVRSGGGVAFFLGERSQADFYTKQLYREGKGIFPLPVSWPSELFPDYLQKTPDLETTSHRIFKVFEGQNNPFLGLVNIYRYFTVPKDWQPAADSTVQVIARLRNGAPLAVEKKVGKGRVVAFLTSAGPHPQWNNWARGNPSYLLAMHELQAYLAYLPGESSPRTVSAPLELAFDSARYEPQFRFARPGEEIGATATVEAASSGNGSLMALLEDIDTSGFYQVRLTGKDGKEEDRYWAVNVDAEEGDLKALSGAEIESRLADVWHRYFPAALFQYASEEHAGLNLAGPLLYFLIFLLIGEQLLAWLASYHPPSIKPGHATGGAR